MGIRYDHDGNEIKSHYNALEAPFNHQTMLDMGFAYDHETDEYYFDGTMDDSEDGEDYEYDYCGEYEDDEDDYYLSPEQARVQKALQDSTDWDQYNRPSSGQQQSLWGAGWPSVSTTSKRSGYTVTTRTSDTHPLKPSYIPVRNGEMGLVICPAKKGSGMVGRHDRDFEKDMTALAEQGVDKVYGLMPKYELVEYKAEALLTETGSYGIEYIYCGWTDRSTPDNDDFWTCVKQALNDLKMGKRIVVHCRGGLGRTGTFAGTVLALAGWHMDSMIDALHEARGTMCPETKEQTTFIRTVCAQQMAARKDRRNIKDPQGRAMTQALLLTEEG